MATNISWPTSVTTFKVLCRLGNMRADSLDTDKNPDLVPIGGTVTIKADVATPWVKIEEADGRNRLVILTSMTYQIDATSGELVGPDRTPGVFLIRSDSPGLDPTGFTYTCTITPEGSGKSITVVIDGTEASDGLVDLANIIPALPSEGISSLEKRVRALENATTPQEPTDPGETDPVDDYAFEDIVASIVGDI